MKRTTGRGAGIECGEWQGGSLCANCESCGEEYGSRTENVDHPRINGSIAGRASGLVVVL